MTSLLGTYWVGSYGYYQRRVVLRQIFLGMYSPIFLLLILVTLLSIIAGQKSYFDSSQHFCTYGPLPLEVVVFLSLTEQYHTGRYQ